MTTHDETLLKLENGFVAYMSGANRNSSETRSKYRISATDFSSDSKSVYLTFTFRAGQRYCCPYSSCHHGLLFGSDFVRLRERFRHAGMEVSRPMKIHMRVICETGALFDDGPRGEIEPPAYEVKERYETDEVYDERVAEK